MILGEDNAHRLRSTVAAKPRFWIAAFAVVFVMSANHAQNTSAHPPAANAAAPSLEFVFEEFVTLGVNLHPGETPFGERNIVPITGGTFSGPGIRGKVLPGGWDWQLATKAGCHSLMANYMIQTDDGAIINVVNKGTDCTGLDSKSRPFTTPTFEAPLGRYAWLNSRAFVGTFDVTTLDGKSAVHIRFYAAK